MRKLFIWRWCVACDGGFAVWFWEEPRKRLNICCAKCQRALDKGYELGLRVGGDFRRTVAERRPAKAVERGLGGLGRSYRAITITKGEQPVGPTAL